MRRPRAARRFAPHPPDVGCGADGGLGRRRSHGPGGCRRRRSGHPRGRRCALHSSESRPPADQRPPWLRRARARRAIGVWARPPPPGQQRRLHPLRLRVPRLRRARAHRLRCLHRCGACADRRADLGRACVPVCASRGAPQACCCPWAQRHQGEHSNVRIPRVCRTGSWELGAPGRASPARRTGCASRRQSAGAHAARRHGFGAPHAGCVATGSAHAAAGSEHWLWAQASGSAVARWFERGASRPLGASRRSNRRVRLGFQGMQHACVGPEGTRGQPVVARRCVGAVGCWGSSVARPRSAGGTVRARDSRSLHVSLESSPAACSDGSSVAARSSRGRVSGARALAPKGCARCGARPGKAHASFVRMAQRR